MAVAIRGSCYRKITEINLLIIRFKKLRGWKVLLARREIMQIMKLLNRLADAGWTQVPYKFPASVKIAIGNKDIFRPIYVFVGMTDKEIVAYTENLRNTPDELQLEVQCLSAMPKDTPKEILDSLDRLLLGE